MLAYTQWYYSEVKNRNLAIFNNMDESRKHCTKWKKTQKHKYCMTSHIWGVQKKKTELTEAENRTVVGRAREWGKSKVVGQSIKTFKLK